MMDDYLWTMWMTGEDEAEPTEWLENLPPRYALELYFQSTDEEYRYA